MTREILRMPSQYAVDHPTFPVNQRHSHLYRDPGGLLSRNNQPPDIWNSQGVYRETFLQIRERLFRHLNVRFQTQFWFWDASQDRQPEIHSTLGREDSWIIMGQTNNDCRSRIFTLDKFTTPATVRLLEDKIQNWGMFLFTISYGSSAYGSKKWRWLIQWMI